MKVDEAAHEFFFLLLCKFCDIMNAAETDDDERLDIAISSAIPLKRKLEATVLEA